MSVTQQEMVTSYMHIDLEKFLRLVWCELRKDLDKYCAVTVVHGRRRHLPIGQLDAAPPKIQALRLKVYNIYNGSSSSKTSLPTPSLSAVQKWLSDLNQLSDFPIRCRAQIGNDFFDFGDIYSRALKLQDEDAIPEIAKGFVHFIDATGVQNANFRVYVNVTPDGYLAILEYIVQDLMQPDRYTFYIGSPPEEPSPLALAIQQEDGNKKICSCKAVGLCEIGVRAEGIVIYCSSMSAAEFVAQSIKTKFPLHYFNSKVPRMTKRIAAGLSIAAEPEQQSTGLSDARQSFGKIRCELITLALVEAYANDKARANNIDDYYYFTGRVAMAFKGYGLNPLEPWL